jgi:hypothetical protein
MELRCAWLRRVAACGGAALMLLLAALPLQGAPAESPGAGAAASAGDPLETFVRGLSSNQQARVVGLVRTAGTNAPERQAALQEALLTLHPELARALDALNADQPAEALPLLDAPARAADPVLATHAAWFRVRALVAGERFEEALACLQTVQTNAARYSWLSGDMLYTEGVLQACLLNRPAARTILQGFLRHYPSAPPERRESAQEVLEDIRRADPASLSEVALLMNDSRRRLQLQDCSEATLARQAGLLELFDAVIEKAEEKKSGGGKASKGTGEGGKPQKGKKSGKMGKAGKGAEESALSDSKGGKADLAEPPTGNAPDDWARAYARERESVQQELQSRVPERYRDLIEQYYRSLSDSSELPSDGAR